MIRSIQLDDRKVSYKFKRYRRQKYMRMTVHADATLTVTAPKWVGVREVEGFILKQSRWVLDSLDKFIKDGAHSFRGSNAEYKRYKERARALVHHRLRFYNQYYKFEYNRISIRNQKTMWGSCSENGNMNFNYKLALLPLHLADYVVVHELCHLKEMNHSKAFWDLVAQTIPDYKQRRNELKKNKLQVG